MRNKAECQRCINEVKNQIENVKHCVILQKKYYEDICKLVSQFYLEVCCVKQCNDNRNRAILMQNQNNQNFIQNNQFGQFINNYPNNYITDGAMYNIASNYLLQQQYANPYANFNGNNNGNNLNMSNEINALNNIINNGYGIPNNLNNENYPFANITGINSNNLDENLQNQKNDNIKIGIQQNLQNLSNNVPGVENNNINSISNMILGTTAGIENNMEEKNDNINQINNNVADNNNNLIGNNFTGGPDTNNNNIIDNIIDKNKNINNNVLENNISNVGNEVILENKIEKNDNNGIQENNK